MSYHKYNSSKNLFCERHGIVNTFFQTDESCIAGYATGVAKDVDDPEFATKYRSLVLDYFWRTTSHDVDEDPRVVEKLQSKGIYKIFGEKPWTDPQFFEILIAGRVDPYELSISIINMIRGKIGRTWVRIDRRNNPSTLIDERYFIGFRNIWVSNFRILDARWVFDAVIDNHLNMDPVIIFPLLMATFERIDTIDNSMKKLENFNLIRYDNTFSNLLSRNIIKRLDITPIEFIFKYTPLSTLKYKVFIFWMISGVFDSMLWNESCYERLVITKTLMLFAKMIL